MYLRTIVINLFRVYLIFLSTIIIIERNTNKCILILPIQYPYQFVKSIKIEGIWEADAIYIFGSLSYETLYNVYIVWVN